MGRGVVLGAVLAALVAAGSAPTAIGTSPDRTYAGLIGKPGAHGIRGDLSAVGPVVVDRGFVAAWIGAGNRFEGPGGSDEWLQVGLVASAGGPPTLYYEYAAPGVPVQFAAIAQDVPSDRSLRVAVLEEAGRVDVWRVWVGGRPVSPSIHLSGSHDRLSPIATVEVFDGGTASCNRYAYRFAHLDVATAPGGVWRPFRSGSRRCDETHSLLVLDDGFVAGNEPC